MVLIRKKKKKSQEQLDAERQEKELQKAGIQDEFQAKGFELVTWVQHHRQTILVGLSAFALAGAVWAGVVYFSGGADQKVSAEYEAALNLYEKLATAKEDEKEKAQTEALKAFEKISQQHSGKGVARLANLYVGHLALESRDPKTAISAYGKFINEAPQKDQLRTVALLGLANAYEATSEPKKALETYESILEATNIDEARVLWQAARLAKETGQEEKAKEFSSKLSERYPTFSIE